MQSFKCGPDEVKVYWERGEITVSVGSYEGRVNAEDHISLIDTTTERDILEVTRVDGTWTVAGKYKPGNEPQLDSAFFDQAIRFTEDLLKEDNATWQVYVDYLRQKDDDADREIQMGYDAAKEGRY